MTEEDTEYWRKRQFLKSLRIITIEKRVPSMIGLMNKMSRLSQQKQRNRCSFPRHQAMAKKI